MCHYEYECWICFLFTSIRYVWNKKPFFHIISSAFEHHLQSTCIDITNFTDRNEFVKFIQFFAIFLWICISSLNTKWIIFLWTGNNLIQIVHAKVNTIGLFNSGVWCIETKKERKNSNFVINASGISFQNQNVQYCPIYFISKFFAFILLRPIRGNNIEKLYSKTVSGNRDNIFFCRKMNRGPTAICVIVLRRRMWRAQYVNLNKSAF